MAGVTTEVRLPVGADLDLVFDAGQVEVYNTQRGTVRELGEGRRELAPPAKITITLKDGYQPRYEQRAVTW